MKYTDYRPTGILERSLASFGNFMLLGVISPVLKEISGTSGLNPTETKIFYSLTMAALVLIFCIFPETPCKRLGRFKILSAEKEEIKLKKRILRAAPFLVLALGLAVAAFVPTPQKGTIDLVYTMVSLPIILSMLFILADSLTILFHPAQLSLLDMKLGTQVMKPPPTPEHVKTRVFGRKII
jgi:hypothetical protein